MEADRLAPAVHEAAADLADCRARAGKRLSRCRNPIDGPAVARMFAGEPFKQRAHEAEYAHHGRGGNAILEFALIDEIRRQCAWCR